ncbi:ExbD/TolR family protein [Pseudaquabacterium rugosum]|uniref:ExbD/TolR family protein n=1 Tax=Pseudaquabacterium rugosum TaxID=2984194 RepID=A0ABU9BGX7_9BURK
MPAVVSRSSGRRSRRAMAEMNMVPFIDVMLVLLIIFMVSAPLITTGVVDLPSVGKAAARPSAVIEVLIESDTGWRLRRNDDPPADVSPAELLARVRTLQDGDAQVPVVISADKSVRYETVVKAMDRLQRGGVARVGLAVRQGG